MARQHATLSALPTALIEATQSALAITPTDEGQRTGQHEVITALESATVARRQRIVVSQSTVTSIKLGWPLAAGAVRADRHCHRA